MQEVWSNILGKIMLILLIGLEVCSDRLSEVNVNKD